MRLRKALYGISVTATAIAMTVANPANAAECDRACLSGLITHYIDALVARDPSKVPLASADVKFTEDSQQLKLGEGLWQTVTGKGAFRQDYLDTTKQVAAAHVTLREGENEVLYSVILHVKDSRIGGVETLVQRVTPDSRFKPTELGKPIRGFDTPVPTDKRHTRKELIEIALRYTDGLRRGDFTDAGVPFSTDAHRIENGAILAGEGCIVSAGCGLYDQRIMVHPSILASVAAVDEEADNVLLWMNFGYTDSYGPGKALVTYEAFKIWGGQIHAINAFFATLPIATPRFWPSSDPVK